MKYRFMVGPRASLGEAGRSGGDGRDWRLPVTGRDTIASDANLLQLPVVAPPVGGDLS